MIEPVEDRMQTRTIELTNQFTTELTDYCDTRVPPLLDNAEYAASCSALLISLTRQLGRCAAAFGAANNQKADDVRVMVTRMFNTNFDRAAEALSSEGQAVQ